MSSDFQFKANSTNSYLKTLSMLLMTVFSAVTVAQVQPTLTPAKERYTDRRVAADLKEFSQLQERLRVLNATGNHPINEYSMAKAQCWLDVSRHEYARNDRSAFPQEALTQSAGIVQFLEQGGASASPQNPALQTPFLNGAAKLREDLWQKIDGIKQSKFAYCAERQVACAEVELVHAGNEFNQQQWRHAKPYVAIAEQQLLSAAESIKQCETQAVAVAPKETNDVTKRDVAPTPPSAPQVVANNTRENWTLSGDTLFRFNRSDVPGMLPQGVKALDELIANLRANYKEIERIQITGHTDHFGSIAYNEVLSKKRAETVALYFSKNGLNVPMSAQGMGPKQPVKLCPNVANQLAQVKCLQPNRRVDVTVIGTRLSLN